MGASASKIKFRESLAALTDRDVSPSDTDFWDELWKIPSSSEEVFELLTPAAARRLRDDRFENLATLFTQSTAQLCQIVETPYTIYFDQALNCVRVLTRVVPFLLEKGDLGAGDPNVELLCWGENKDDDEEEGETTVTGGTGTTGADGTTTATGYTRETSTSTGEGSVTVVDSGSGEGEESLEIEASYERKKSLPTSRGRRKSALSPRSRKSSSSRASSSQGDKENIPTPKGRGGGRGKGKKKRKDESASEEEEGEEESAFYDDSESDETDEETSAAEEDDEEEEEEDNEPLALLVVHAAMHMLFLPQFTCEFYEEDGDARDDDAGLGSDDEDEDLISRPGEDPEETRRLDRDGRAEAGLGRPRRIARGVRLAPRPAGIVWAPGVGFTKDGKCHVGSALAAAAERAREQKGGRGGGGGRKGKKGGGGDDPAAPVRLNPEAAYTRKYDKNRIEVLRLLLAACSDPLFSPADEYNPLASRWMSVAVAADAPNAPCLFYSLLNTVISYDPHADLGFGTSGFSGDTHVKLVELSAQVLCVLLDCGLSGDPVPYVNGRGEPVASPEEAYRPGFNVFRVLLARIDNGKDLDTLYRGFVRLLRNMFETKSALLPSSQVRLECHQELLILLWKALEENPLFLDFVLTRCDVCELVVPICYLMYVSRRDDAQVGLIHICTFVLLKLSGERSFGVGLNRPFRTKLPCDLPLFSGSHADLVSITLHKIIVNGSYRLVPLYSCFLTIVCNFSPYWRSMSLVASVKLVNLFELFSSPKFLYSGEKAYRHLALLLEIFNNIIQYQYIGNQHLVYAIVRRKDSFGRLVSLTLPKAIHQCNKAFPSSEKPEYDADAEDRAHAAQVEAIAVQSVDQSGKPTKKVDSEKDIHTKSSREKAVPGRFVPTEAWMAELKANLPVETVNRLLQHLVPVVDDMCRHKNGVVDETEILEVFKDITMVGLLPVPHAIVIRKYQANQYTSIWFTAFMWGVIFLRSQRPPIFDKECIQLFQVSDEDEGKKR
ncbi:hypothetical protein ACHAWF_014186 [Thalassiosira exigua]